MANKKISELTSKSANLEDNDLFAIAEDNGSGSHNSKKITGEDIKHGITKVSKSSQSTNYTLALSDRDKLVEMDVATANTLTVPAESSVNFEIGTQVIMVQKGAGQITISGDTGVTVYSEGSKTKTVGRYALATLIKCDSDTWYLGGNLEA
ncbi:MAG: hypothetical protein Unbinned221contig1000_42 [Prokaryotic dsDNA virus sp.]|nr:MAG: hypothetical protein Unbinned221contig1000_42 [Prokaryotic dsDNA virus sp.]|tara:strand:- start:2320 stop:2772 length:453 start_codon:yes stop_codon:yes gene_type:complete